MNRGASMRRAVRWRTRVWIAPALVASALVACGPIETTTTHRLGALALETGSGWRVAAQSGDDLELRLTLDGSDRASLFLSLRPVSDRELESIVDEAMAQARRSAEVVPGAWATHGSAGDRTVSRTAVIRQNGVEILSLIAARSVRGQGLLAVLSTADQASLDATMGAFNAIMESVRGADERLEPSEGSTAARSGCRTVLQPRFVPSYGGCVGAYCTPSWGGHYVNAPRVICDGD